MLLERVERLAAHRQTRTRELLAQLEHRKRDDEALPTPEQWTALKAKLSRGDQALYLVRRLRAITAIQWGQPGGVSYEEPQWVEGFVPGPQKTRLINPVVELLALKLQPAEVAPLVPWLGDAAYMRMYSYWRDFHPARDLHRAADALAWVINEALQTPVVDLRGFDRKTAAERAELIARVASWIKERAGRSGRELLRERVRAAKTIDQLGEAISRAGADQDPETITLILEREKDFASERARLAHYAFLTGDRRALPRAEQWLADPKLATDGRVMAGLIVLQHRPAAARVTALTPMMSAVDIRLRTFVIDRIERAGLAKTPEARALTCMAGPAVNDHDVGLALLHRQVRAGCPDAGAALAQAIESGEVHGHTSGERSGQPVEVTQTWGDHHAGVVNAWRRKPSDFDVLMPDAERARHRAEIKAWILAEAAAVRGGAKPVVPAAQPLMMLPWSEQK